MKTAVIYLIFGVSLLGCEDTALQPSALPKTLGMDSLFVIGPDSAFVGNKVTYHAKVFGTLPRLYLFEWEVRDSLPIYSIRTVRDSFEYISADTGRKHIQLSIYDDYTDSVVLTASTYTDMFTDTALRPMIDSVIEVSAQLSTTVKTYGYRDDTSTSSINDFIITDTSLTDLYLSFPIDTGTKRVFSDTFYKEIDLSKIYDNFDSRTWSTMTGILRLALTPNADSLKVIDISFSISSTTQGNSTHSSSGTNYRFRVENIARVSKATSPGLTIFDFSLSGNALKKVLKEVDYASGVTPKVPVTFSGRKILKPLQIEGEPTLKLLVKTMRR